LNQQLTLSFCFPLHILFILIKIEQNYLDNRAIKMNSYDKVKKEHLKQEYLGRINKVLDYIDENIDKELNLKVLSDISNFSSYHFHRIFSSLMNETLNSYIKRVRVQKAASLLAGNMKKSATEIAFDTGFKSSAVFSKVFKEFFGLSPTEYRNSKLVENSKNEQMESKNEQQNSKIEEDFNRSESYFASEIFQNQIRSISMNVEIKELPETTVAYVRHIGPYAGDGALFGRLFEKLFKWAGPRGLVNFPETQTYSVYHDDPEVTEEDKLRVSVCLSVPDETSVDGEIGKMRIGGGKFAVAHFELKNDEYSAAWSKFMGEWFPKSGYQPDDRLCFEHYLNDPNQHPEGKCIVDICMPVKPL